MSAITPSLIAFCSVPSAINWKADAWFTDNHYKDLNDEFKEFWVKFYGTPGEAGDDAGEQHEYWVRCAFCLIGWNANYGGIWKT